MFRGEVVHSYTTTDVGVSTSSPSVVVECIIPEGEYYWENENDMEYASLSLKIIHIL